VTYIKRLTRDSLGSKRKSSLSSVSLSVWDIGTAIADLGGTVSTFLVNTGASRDRFLVGLGLIKIFTPHDVIRAVYKELRILNPSGAIISSPIIMCVDNLSTRCTSHVILAYTGLPSLLLGNKMFTITYICNYICFSLTSPTQTGFALLC